MDWFISSDHGGVNLKSAINKYLKEKNININDLGTNSSTESTDYPDNADILVQKILNNQNNMGILICGTGIGVSIRANRYKGIRAALINNEFTAKSAKEHNNANIICFGERVTTIEQAKKYIDIFLNAKYQGGRHNKRLKKLDAPLSTTITKEK